LLVVGLRTTGWRRFVCAGSGRRGARRCNVETRRLRHRPPQQPTTNNRSSADNRQPLPSILSPMPPFTGRRSARVAAFPKCFMDQLCVTHSMTLFDWIEMAKDLGVGGLEMYAGFFTSFDEKHLGEVRAALQRSGFSMPMFCYSPDFTHPDPARRAREVEQQKQMIAVTAFLGGSSCRVLSGQRRPEVGLEEGIGYVVAAIEELLPVAQQHQVALVMENHYKDNYWTYPEFAQQQDVFCAIVERIRSPWFGVQFDPSNAILAGDDPVALLRRVKQRVLTMHASDRFLLPGHTLEELRTVENQAGYAAILSHGVVGRGLNDYDAIFKLLQEVDFNGWISIEDGMNGLDEIRESAEFLKRKIAQYLS